MVAHRRRRFCFPGGETQLFPLQGPHKAKATSKEVTGTGLQAAIVGFVSPVGFFAELCINKPRRPETLDLLIMWDLGTQVLCKAHMLGTAEPSSQPSCLLFFIPINVRFSSLPT